ncbi:MAG: TIGR00296 family protein [Candidatus Aenigmatarchaeota archaeon]
MISESSGKFLVQLARDVIVSELKEEVIVIPPEYPRELDQRTGIFVTLFKKMSGFRQLRGCIGLAYPEKPLVEGCVQAAIAVLKDDRFPAIKLEDVDSIEVEVSVLTEPTRMTVEKPEDYLEKIEIGRDGLIIKKGIMSGLLLPQVPVEQAWDVQQYLNNLCIKAGLSENTWLDPAAEIYRFKSQIFK